VLVLAAGWLGMGLWGALRPLPAGIGLASQPRAAESVRFLADYSYVDAAGRRRVEQRIFDRIFGHIERAERLVVLDMFLFNDFAGNPDGADMRPLSIELTAALVRARRERPGLRALLITDPINTLYGGLVNENIEALRAAGVEVVVTDLKRLRDSNPAWSGLWRLCCGWAGNDAGSGWLPNPMGGRKVTLRSLLALLNFKANHRKTLFADTPTGWVGLVTSANPHDASSAHSNIALEFRGRAAVDLLGTERAVAAFSAPLLDWPAIAAPGAQPSGHGARVQVLTESAIREAALAALGQTGEGGRVDLAMFYLSHRDVIDALKSAARRGAIVRALLDANHDAFGREKNGVPNRPVAAELTGAGVEVRWCNTTGEQCHDKLLLVQTADGGAELIAGSANFTRRNLDDYNLETNLRLAATAAHPAIGDAAAWFERRWHNRPGEVYSLAYAARAEESRLKRWLYRFMEATGLSTF